MENAPKRMRVRLPLIPLPFRFGISNGTLGQGGSLGRLPAPQIFLSERWIGGRQKTHRQVIRSPSHAGGYGSSEESFATSYWKISSQMVGDLRHTFVTPSHGYAVSMPVRFSRHQQ